MTSMKSITGRIEVHYAAVQGTYWASICTLVGFSTVYLSHQGLSDTLIGLAYSLFGILSILLQMLLSNFSDHHAEIPLKSVVAAVFGAAVVCGASLLFIPLPIAGLVALYIVVEASQASAPGLANALMMQYVDRGLPVNYGWPRGIGSIGYAVSAFILGRFVASRSPDILLPIFIALATAAGLSVIAMPNPDRMAALRPAGTAAPAARGGEDDSPVPTYWQMLRGNPTLAVFLCACVVAAVGQSSGITFLIRIMQSVGGGTKEMGIGMLIQSGAELPAMLLSSALLKKWRARRILVVSFTSTFLKSMLLALAPSLGFVYGALALSVFCYGLFGFASVFYVNGLVKPSEKVRAQSLVTLCYNNGLGSIIGNLYSGSVIDAWGLKVLLVLNGFVCLAAAVLMLVSSRLNVKCLSDAGRRP